MCGVKSCTQISPEYVEGWFCYHNRVFFSQSLDGSATKSVIPTMGQKRSFNSEKDSVVRAVEAAVRSSGGGHNAPSRPIGVALPDSDAGATAARVGVR